MKRGSESWRASCNTAASVKAESCDECRTYAKMIYQMHDPKLDPFADDLASLGLDLMVAEAGWSRQRRIAAAHRMH